MGGDFREGQLKLCATLFESHAGHAIDHGGGLILGEGLGSGLPQGEEPVGAVVAHPGEHTGEHMREVAGPGDRAEEDIDGGALMPDRWRIIEFRDPAAG